MECKKNKWQVKYRFACVPPQLLNKWGEIQFSPSCSSRQCFWKLGCLAGSKHSESARELLSKINSELQTATVRDESMDLFL